MRVFVLMIEGYPLFLLLFLVPVAVVVVDDDDDDGIPEDDS